MGWVTQPTDSTSHFESCQSVQPIESALQTDGTCRPSGVKCGTIGCAVSIVGRVLLAQQVGRPNPYAYSFGCSRSNFRASRFRCRPAGALGYLLCRVFYKHAAPLGLNAAQLAARYPSWGEFSSPSGLGDPTPTHTASVAHVPIFVPPGSDVAPLGLWDICCAVCSINMPPLWG